MFFKRDNIEFARWMRRGSMLFLAGWNSMCSGSEENLEHAVTHSSAAVAKRLWGKSGNETGRGIGER